MSGIKFIKAADRTFEKIGGDPGAICAGRDVTTGDSTTIGCSVVTFENCHMEWTVLYDEYIYCLEGSFTIKTKEGDFVLEPGDGIWLPDGTWMIYVADAKATAVVAVYPVDWKDRAGA
jgi:ethanolamine utilization protein EutQ